MTNEPAKVWRRARLAACGAAKLLAIVAALPTVGTRAPSVFAATAGAPYTSMCRVTNTLAGGMTNVGSGTLVDVTPDRSRGLVITCAHLFMEGRGQIVATFPDGSSHGGLLAAIDGQADLAAVEIGSPRSAPVEVSLQNLATGELRACGFGGSGEFRCVTGANLGTAERSGQVSVRIRGAVRSGDSGGGVFDGAGRLCAVVWGEADGTTYATTGPPLQRFYNRLLGGRLAAQTQRPAVLASCPNGMCPLVRPGVVFGSAPAASSPPIAGGAARSCDCGDKWASFDRRLGVIEASQSANSDYLTASDLKEYARREELRLLESRSESGRRELESRVDTLPLSGGGWGKAAGLAAVTLLGISGPVGLAVVAGATVGGWLIARRARRRAKSWPNGASGGDDDGAHSRLGAVSSARSHDPREATAAADSDFPHGQASIDVYQPIERDDREGRELLRLSQLEGRDPLQDAVAGRIALDRLDAAADGDGDPQRAEWADELRRELRERFNEIAPTKFQVEAAP